MGSGPGGETAFDTQLDGLLEDELKTISIDRLSGSGLSTFDLLRLNDVIVEGEVEGYGRLQSHRILNYKTRWCYLILLMTSTYSISQETQAKL